MTARLTIFDERDDCLLIYLPSGCSVQLPRLVSPFRRADLLAAIKGQEDDVRVTVEPKTGRWSDSLMRRMRDVQCEKVQQQMAQEAARIALVKTSNNPDMRDRAELATKKYDVDIELRDLKTKLSRAKAEAYHRGKYMDRGDFLAMERRIRQLQMESQAIQRRLSEFKDRTKRGRIAHKQTEAERFMEAARDMLDHDMFFALLDAATEDGESDAQPKGESPANEPT